MKEHKERDSKVGMRLVDKTYEDDKGYLVTEKIWEPDPNYVPPSDAPPQAPTTSDRTTHAVPVTTSCNRVEVRVGLGISKPMLNQRMKDPDHEDRNGQMAMIHVVTASSFTYACTRSMLDPAPGMHLLLSAMANTPGFLRSVGDGTGNFCEWAGDCRGTGGGRPSEGLRLDPTARLD